MAIDLGALFQGGVDLMNAYGNMTSSQLASSFGGGATVPITPPNAPISTMPPKVTVDTRTGKVTTCRRRRRKPLLTDADFAALAKVASLPNTANVRTALAQAIRR